MILFRHKYPRWWFDWNLELQRFANRVGAYLALLDDKYPATDAHQSVRLDYSYPDAATTLNRWLPLVKWLLAIPHYIVLFFLVIGAIVAAIIAGFPLLLPGPSPPGLVAGAEILLLGPSPPALFAYVGGVFRWTTGVRGYAFAVVPAQPPPFSLR